MDTKRMDAIARRQHLVITRRQAMEAGMSKRTWYRRIERDGWTELHPGVAALPGAMVTAPVVRAAAAALAVGRGALTSHGTAAWLWVGEPAPDDIDVVVAQRGRSPELDGVRVHRPTDLDDLRPSRRNGIAVVTPPRVLVDLGATEGPGAVAGFLERSLVLGLFGMAAARAVLERHACRGREGVGALRQVLDEWTLGDRPPDSVLEARMSDVFSRYHVPAGEFQRPLTIAGRCFVPDWTYLPERVLIEVLGWNVHGTRTAFERDPEKVAILAGAGFQTLPFTWLQVVRRPGWVAERILEVLAIRRPLAA